MLPVDLSKRCRRCSRVSDPTGEQSDEYRDADENNRYESDKNAHERLHPLAWMLPCRFTNVCFAIEVGNAALRPNWKGNRSDKIAGGTSKHPG